MISFNGFLMFRFGLKGRLIVSVGLSQEIMLRWREKSSDELKPQLIVGLKFIIEESTEPKSSHMNFGTTRL